ncbi:MULTISPECIES: DUF3775 domain-containing protein [unclassified Roseitalea]|uniref:DUF3775 domain-containing protein n=1 Tax=unclassified Roseitalea TaxID=2639107 RepID=UPI00273E09E0|nr:MULTISPECIES: DUF3775 domain-containing protein [unclassified Roseitalea]
MANPPIDQAGTDFGGLTVALEKVCFIIFKARSFDAKYPAPVRDPASNPTDDGDLSVLADYPDDPEWAEMTSLISALNVDEQADLIALMWLGRGEYTAEDWDTVREEAARSRNEQTARYLCGTPLLADHLSNGLSELDLSCEEYELAHL